MGGRGGYRIRCHPRRFNNEKVRKSSRFFLSRSIVTSFLIRWFVALAIGHYNNSGKKKNKKKMGEIFKREGKTLENESE